MADARRELALTGALDLRATVSLQCMWSVTSWMRVDGTGAWYARRTPEGPATVRVQHAGDHLLAEAWGPGATLLLDAVPAWLGLEDAGVQAIVTDDPALRELVKRLPGYRMGRTDELYERLVSVALAQKVTGKEAASALRGLARRWGEPAPGPREDLILLPDSATLSRKPYYDFHPLGIDQRRAELVLRIASRARALGRAAGMGFQEARAHLEALPGIGPWTSGVVVGGVLGDPDAVPWGDFHLPNYLAYNLRGEARSDDAAMEVLLAPYLGQRGRVARLVHAVGKDPPRFGPRSAVRDIRGL